MLLTWEMSGKMQDTASFSFSILVLEKTALYSDL
jgi:hypothetical protein